MTNDEHLRRAFSYFDKDGNGFIESEELREALEEDGAPDSTGLANDILYEVDTDKVVIPSFSRCYAVSLFDHQQANLFVQSQDGRISYDEFVVIMKTGADWRKASWHHSRGSFNSSLKCQTNDGWILKFEQ